MFGFSCAVLDSGIAVLWIVATPSRPLKSVSGVPHLGRHSSEQLEKESLFLWASHSLGPEC